MRVPLSILDLAPIARGQTAGDSFANSVALAQRAEELGYLRVWYAEHHNIASIASSATSVLIAHVGARTRSIRLGAGGVMLPNQMLTYSAVGTPAQVSDYLDGFIRHTEADEVIVAHQAPTIEGRLRSVTLLAEAMQAVPA